MEHFDLAAVGPGFWVFVVVEAAVTFACFAAMVGLRFRRRGAARFWVGPALVALAVLPGAVAAVFTAIAFHKVLEGIALVGSRGSAALAAGSMESLLPLLVGVACMAILGLLGVLIVAAGSSRVDEQAAPAGFALGSLLAPLVVVAGFVPLFLATAFVNRMAFGAIEPGRVVWWWRATVIVSVAAALALAAFAVVSALRAPRSRAPLLAKLLPPLSLLVVPLGAAILWLFLFGCMARLAALATHGEPQVASAEETAPEEPEAVPSAEPGTVEAPPQPAPTEASPERQPDPVPRATARPRPTAAPVAERPSPVRVGGSILEPRKVKNVSPFYPAAARAARVQGIVILECTIGRDGRVGSVKVLRGVPLLDAAAVEAVRQWVYEPTVLGGVPVPVIMTVTVNFKLS
jgi:protein TonB